MSTMTVETLEEASKQLSPEDRERLLESLIVQVRADADPEVEAAWLEIAARRQAEIESGEVELLSGAETIAALRAEFC
jgi:hypothetical protein